ncbi:MAG: prolipoprotein diacylglyceryl transferase [Clostridia bacterium]|nr:prolipoprotein diacylglyceryl transferase [Clostridia bacterium]
MKCKSCQRDVDLLWNCCPYCSQKLNGMKIVNVVMMICGIIVFSVGSIRSVHNGINMLAIVIFEYFVINLAKSRGYSFINTLSLVAFEMFGIMVLGKIYTYLIYARSQEIKSIFNAGLGSYGALLGIITMLIVYKFIFKAKTKELLYISLMPVPILYAIGKIGCLVDGCCYGIDYDGLLSITYQNSAYAPIGEVLFPIQLVEAIVFFMIYLLNRFVYNKNKTKSMEQQLILVVTLCAASKFALDFLRASHDGQIISKNQIISIIVLLMTQLGRTFLTQNCHKGQTCEKT